MQNTVRQLMVQRAPARRRLSSVADQLLATSASSASAAERAGDPHYLMQEVSAPYSALVQVGVGSGALPAGSTVMVFTTSDSVGALGLPAAQEQDFGGKSAVVTMTYSGTTLASTAGASRVVAVGVGAAAEVTSEGFRAAVTAGVAALKAARITGAYVLLPSDTPMAQSRLIADFTVAAVLADYSFDIYITDASRKFHVGTLTVFSDDPGAGAAAAAAHAVAKGQCTARDLVNTRAGVATPQYMQERAEELCEAYPGRLSMKVVDDAEMIEKGMGLIHGVGMVSP